jgi:hypothetical protein
LKNLLKVFLYSFITLSALGLVLSLATHIARLLGFHPPEELNLLALGIFIIWFPAVIVLSLITDGAFRKDIWKVGLSGAPKWMHYMSYGFSIYALFNLVIFIVIGGSNPVDSEGSMLRGLSGFILPFYSFGLAIFYSASQIGKNGLIRKCANGHQVSFSARYCENCGQQILDDVIIR